MRYQQKSEMFKTKNTGLIRVSGDLETHEDSQVQGQGNRHDNAGSEQSEPTGEIIQI